MTRRARKRRDAIVTAHLGLVASIAFRVHTSVPAIFPLADLIAEGNLALLRAAERYDPAAHNGTPFSAFARMYIRGAILETCRRKAHREATRPSISGDRGTNDELFSQSRRSSVLRESEIAKAFRRMASPPFDEDSIDSGRMERRLGEAIAQMPAESRALIEKIYFDGKRLSPRAEKLHSETLAWLRARLAEAA